MASCFASSVHAHISLELLCPAATVASQWTGWLSPQSLRQHCPRSHSTLLLDCDPNGKHPDLISHLQPHLRPPCPPHCRTGTSDHQPDPLRPFRTQHGPSSGSVPSHPSAWTLSPPSSAGPPTAGHRLGFLPCHSPLPRSWFPLSQETILLVISYYSCLRINTMKRSA